jgi:hypothetical protein
VVGSRLVKKATPYSSSNNSYTVGIGYMFFNVRAFKCLKLVHSLQLKSFFTIGSKGEEKGLELCWMMPFLNISAICLSISFFCSRLYWYGLIFIGWAPGIKGIVWSKALFGGNLFVPQIWY